MKIGALNIKRKALLPPLLAIILLIAVILTGRPRQEGAMDFRAGRWGVSPKEILDRESAAGFTPSEKLKEDDRTTRSTGTLVPASRTRKPETLTSKLEELFLKYHKSNEAWACRFEARQVPDEPDSSRSDSFFGSETPSDQ